MNDNELTSAGDDSWLVQQWIVAGIVSASARFIPVPFVDEIVRQQCRRFVVARTLAASQSVVSLDDMKPFYADADGCLGGCVGTLVKAPLKLLLFPIRKLAAIVTSIRGVPLEVTRMILLGRTIDRHAKSGQLVSDETYVRSLRMAFDEASARMDFRVVHAAIRDALRAAKGWKSSATAQAAEVAKRPTRDGNDLHANDDIKSGAEKIQLALYRPMIAQLFADFDRRFDQSLAEKRQQT